jgi:hypothetical protein
MKLKQRRFQFGKWLLYKQTESYIQLRLGQKRLIYGKNIRKHPVLYSERYGHVTALFYTTNWQFFYRNDDTYQEKPPIIGGGQKPIGRTEIEGKLVRGDMDKPKEEPKMIRILMNRDDYQRYVSDTEAFIQDNPEFDFKIRAEVKPAKGLMKGTALVNGKFVEVK